jgi:hypothetical protein
MLGSDLNPHKMQTTAMRRTLFTLMFLHIITKRTARDAFVSVGDFIARRYRE